ncbi:UDP-GalNAc:beta-1,3-N-acetylgalactosaminyltransferase 2-like [Diadema antillarum]|uniref:UDP-GalNAc:beta-1, 3-N-acetylgalactosaminyltransferase 2-like n=1 Tax=Diadema antillarum TaxID=105358 RepID=UPI003A890AC3
MAGWPSVLVAIGVALAVIVVNEESMYNRRRSRSGNPGKHNHQTKCDIFLAILSARDHFEQRKAVRDTWLGYIRTHPKWKKRICSKFVVGNRSCHLPLDYRRDPYSCSPLNITKSGRQKDIVAMTVMNDTGIHRLSSGPIGFDFKVHYPIILHKLGVFDSAADGIKHPLTVALFDTWRQEKVVGARFSPEQPGVFIEGYRFRAVEPYLLPKGFEGTIVVNSFNKDDPSTTLYLDEGATNNGGGVIDIQQYSRYSEDNSDFPEKVEKLDRGMAALVSGNFIYNIHEPNKLTGWMNVSDEQSSKWRVKVTNETKALELEAATYGDLLLLNVVDTYRNIPSKMLQFYEWLVQLNHIEYAIKTDDDVFMNIDHIMQHFTMNKFPEPKLWWGQFRTGWTVEHHGKWAEHDYQSPVYPSFACGSGSLMSMDLVRWIASNSRHLHRFQGEDVSLGIWLAAVQPSYHDDPRWHCDNVCSASMYVSAELSAEDLRTRWQNRKQCGDPCGCG